VWDVEGKVLTKIADRPLNLGTADPTAPDPSEPPAMASQQGKREIAWREDGQGLTYLEQDAPPAAAEGAAGARGTRAAGGGRGDQAGPGARGQAPQRKDRLYQWLPPFEEKGAKVLFENNTRMNGLRFSPDMQTIFFRETAGTGATASTIWRCCASKALRFLHCRWQTSRAREKVPPWRSSAFRSAGHWASHQ